MNPVEDLPPAGGGAEPAVEFRAVDIVFGRRTRRALELLDDGADRAAILVQTGCVLGVAGASLKVMPGEISVLMGLSGSGKSTLLRSVNGLNPISRGQVLLADQGRRVDVSRCPARVLRRLRGRRVSMVFQQFALLPWRTVAENVALGLELRGASRAEREQAVAEKLELVGLSERRDSLVAELSGGMQQRVGLARALATDADILLMDEPFSALDPLIRSRLQDELLSLQRALHKTIVFVSHDLDEALKLGNHISIMEGGRIVQHGEPELIVLQPANEYVADFVAHMNPLNVLRGGSVMTPLARVERRGDTLLLGDALVDLDQAGRPLAARSERCGPLRLQPVEPQAPADAGPDASALVLAPVGVPLREALRLRHASGRPLLLTEAGRAVGVLGDAELYRAILGESR